GPEYRFQQVFLWHFRHLGTPAVILTRTRGCPERGRLLSCSGHAAARLAFDGGQECPSVVSTTYYGPRTARVSSNPMLMDSSCSICRCSPRALPLPKRSAACCACTDSCRRASTACSARSPACTAATGHCRRR